MLEHKSAFEVKLKVDRFFPLKRRVQFSEVEILAYLGGLLGKFNFYKITYNFINCFKVYLLDSLFCHLPKSFICSA